MTTTKEPVGVVGVGLMGTARKVVRGVTDAGKDLLGAIEGEVPAKKPGPPPSESK